MANLQILRKRLSSIQATGSMASAMKTVASVKYAKLSRIVAEFKEYYEELDAELDIVADSAFARDDKAVQMRNCYVIFSSNRGFCGGFNSGVLKLYESVIAEDPFDGDPLIVTCGDKAEKYFSHRKIRTLNQEMPDIPSFEDAEKLAEFLLEIYLNGEAKTVYIISQKFINMMKQEPVMTTLLPHIRTDGKHVSDDDILYLPDRKSFSSTLALDALTSEIYEILLMHCTGAQAATVVAMKNACDNAEESAAKLEIEINRIRQAEVTNSVIETSSGMAFE